jgi:hypothetical protein
VIILLGTTIQIKLAPLKMALADSILLEILKACIQGDIWKN